MSRYWTACKGIAMHWNAMHATDFLPLDFSIHFLRFRSISMLVNAFQFMWSHCNALECNACYRFPYIRIFDSSHFIPKSCNACQSIGIRVKALQCIGMQCMIRFSLHWNLRLISFVLEAFQCMSRLWNACQGIAIQWNRRHAIHATDFFTLEYPMYFFWF